MFRDFCFSPFFQSFPQHFSMQQGIPFIQSYIKNSFVVSNLVKQSEQSYTTKQIAVKQEVILAKKQEDQVIQPKGKEKHAQMRKRKQNKSIFHNYQKHLVTTLKQKIIIEEIKEIPSTDQCLKELWKGFTKAKIANRSLLLAVFGQEKSSDEELVTYLQKCQLQEIITKFSISEIKEAQSKIRTIVKEYFKDKNLEEELAGRKLPDSEKNVFKHYVAYFLSQLAQGTLNRRLPKRYKRQMML